MSDIPNIFMFQKLFKNAVQIYPSNLVTKKLNIYANTNMQTLNAEKQMKNK